MFKKLKDKIAEEVKISPQRIQQFTQSVTDKLQQSNGNDENLFSISEDDAPSISGSSNYDGGFTNVSLHASTPETSRHRRNSNSSMASDVSFLPRYESSMNPYHLQSDLDISASELEDNASTSSQQLGHVSKEQVHLAFQKAQMRYHKYRGRYTDLANHYKELDRDNAKMKAVLVETQDKAIRRVSELREQCTLSQKAKADLEQALRTELEEKQIIISTLKDKVDLLQNNSRENDAVLAENSEIESLKEKLQELKANNIVLQTKDAEGRLKLTALEQSLADLRVEHSALEDREKSNNLKFAKSKLELHTELQNRDLEVTNLKHDLETVRHELEAYENNNLKTQNAKLIEKCETLSHKCQNYEFDLLRIEQYKLEIAGLQKERTESRQALQQLRETESSLNENLQQANIKCSEIQEDTKKSLLGLEVKIRAKLQMEYDLKYTKQKETFEDKLRQLEANNEGSKETQFKLMEHQDKVVELEALISELQLDLQHRKDAYKELETNQLELIEENNGREVEIGVLGKNHAAREAQLVGELKNVDAEKIAVLKENDLLEKQLQQLQVVHKNMCDNHNELLLKIKQDAEVAKQNIDDIENKYKQVVKELQDETDAVKKELENKLTELHVANKNIVIQKELEKQLLDIQEELKHHKELQNKVLAEKELLTKRANELERDYKNIVAAKSELDIKLIEVSKEKDVIQQELVQLIKLNGLHNEQTHSAQLLQNELDELQSQHNSIKQDFETCKTTIVALKDDYISVQNERDAACEELQQTSNTVKLLTQQLQTARNELQTVHDTEIIRYIARIKQLESDAVHLQEACELERMNMALVAKESGQLNELKVEMKKMEDMVRQLKEDCYSKETSLQSALEKQSQLQSDLINLEPYKEKTVQLTEEVKTAKNNLSLQNQTVADLNERLKLVDQMIENSSNESSMKLKCLQDEINELKGRNMQVTDDNQHLTEENERLMMDCTELRLKYENFDELQAQIHAITNDKAKIQMELETKLVDITMLKEQNTKLQQNPDETDTLRTQLNDLNIKYEKVLEENQIANLAITNYLAQLESCKRLETQLNDLEHHCSELSHERQLLRDEIEELKTSPLNLNNDAVESLREKLAQYKSIDQTNRSSIEFYENELQKLKNKNEKLNRKLDETLVTLNHCADLSGSTEIEYLKNVLYNYMLGKESVVMARVLAAVCKFDRQQTETILKHEQHKQSLLGQLGIL